MRRRRKTLRLEHYDYSQAGVYFITVCIYGGEHILGKIMKAKMILSDAGETARHCWFALKNKFSTIELDEFVIMPNHIHGIIMITNNCRGGVTPPLGEETSPLQRPTLGQIVAYYKYQAARTINHARNTAGCSVWQRNYYEHIVRNETELCRIREYIQNNPINWDLDRENPFSKNFKMDCNLYWRQIYERKNIKNGNY